MIAKAWRIATSFADSPGHVFTAGLWGCAPHVVADRVAPELGGTIHCDYPSVGTRVPAHRFAQVKKESQVTFTNNTKTLFAQRRV